MISLISSGYYLFISEYFNISEKNFLDREIVNNEIIEEEKDEKVSAKICIGKSLNKWKIVTWNILMGLGSKASHK